MSYLQMRHSFAIWGTLLVGAANTNGTILFGQLQDTNLYRAAADHLKTDDAFSVAGTMGVTGAFVGAAIVQGTPINSLGGSALTVNGDVGFDGSTFYYRTGGSIFNLTPDGTIAI